MRQHKSLVESIEVHKKLAKTSKNISAIFFKDTTQIVLKQKDSQTNISHKFLIISQYQTSLRLQYQNKIQQQRIKKILQMIQILCSCCMLPFLLIQCITIAWLMIFGGVAFVTYSLWQVLVTIINVMIMIFQFIFSIPLLIVQLIRVMFELIFKGFGNLFKLLHKKRVFLYMLLVCYLVTMFIFLIKKIYQVKKKAKKNKNNNHVDAQTKKIYNDEEKEKAKAKTEGNEFILNIWYRKWVEIWKSDQ